MNTTAEIYDRLLHPELPQLLLRRLPADPPSPTPIRRDEPIQPFRRLSSSQALNIWVPRKVLHRVVLVESSWASEGGFIRLRGEEG